MPSSISSTAPLKRRKRVQKRAVEGLRSFRPLWQVRIIAAARPLGITYSRFMEGLKLAQCDLDRKVISDLAATDPAKFAELVKTAQAALQKSSPPKRGLVSSCIHGSSGQGTPSDFTPAQIVAVLRAGLAVEELKDLQASLAVPMDRLVPMLGISKATLHRRKNEGRLDQAESDRVVRYARLMGKAIGVMETEENARQWLNSPQMGLGGAVPLEYAETEVGAREVENLLGRIEYGVYS